MPPAGGNSAANNQQLQAMLELERRGELPATLQPQLNAYRSQGLAPPAPTTVEDSNIENATNVVTAAQKARDSVGWGTTGITGALLSKVPGSSAAGLRGYIDTLKSNLAFSELAKMRAASPTGGALGQVSEGEERLLSSTVASLDPNLPDDQLKAGFNKVIDHYGRYLKSLGYSDDKIAAVMKGENPVASPPGSPDPTTGVTPPASMAPADPTDPNAPVTGKVVTAPILEVGSSNLIGTPSTGPVPTIDINDKDSVVQGPEFRAGLNKLLDTPGVTADQIRTYWQQNAKGGLPGDTPAGTTPPAPPLAVERGKNGLTDRLDAGIRGAADVASMGFADEIAAGGRTLFGDKTMAENLAAERGVDAYDSDNHPGYRIAGQLAGGAVLPMGEAATPAELARTGGAYGAAYGFGSTNGSLQDRFMGAGVGGVTGAAGGYGLGKLSELFQGRTPPGIPPTGNPVADAAARQNIPIVAADVAPGARGANALLESIPFAGGVVRRRMDAGNDAIESQVADLAGGVSAGDRTAVGEDVQTGAKNWIKKSGAIKDALYGRAQDLAGDTQIVPKGAIDAIDTHLADLQRTPSSNAHKIDVLQTMRGDMVDAAGNPKPLDIDSLRQIRTNVREQMDTKNIRSNDLDRRLGDIKSAITGDVSESLAGNPRALSAYGRADAFAADRATRIDNVLSSVIGPKNDNISGEQVMAKIESMASPGRGTSEKLGVLMQSLRPDEREQVAAHIANTLGRADADSDFSSGLLLRQVRKLSPRARVQIFGKNGAEALSDLATVAEARAATISKLNNTGSGRVSNYLQVMKGLVGLGGGAGVGAAAGIGAPAGALITAGGLVGANISARVLTNPAVARALAQGLRATTKQAAQNTITRLGNIATSNPAIRTEVLGIQRRLSQAVNDNLPIAGRAAASPDEGPGNEQ